MEETRYCNEDRHNAVIERIERNERILDYHDKKIDELDRQYATLFSEMKHLTKSINWLTTAIWSFVASVVMFVGHKLLSLIFG